MRGPSGRLGDPRETRTTAVVLDFSSVQQPGERTFTLDASNVNMPRGIQLTRVIPAQLRFRFEPRIVRKVPVEVRFSVPHPGYVVAGYRVRPEELTVTGPQSSMEKTQSVVTDPIDISSVVSSKEFRVNTYVAEPRVRFQSSSQVAVDVAVKKK
jgi:YbbR domain-containing protein